MPKTHHTSRSSPKKCSRTPCPCQIAQVHASYCSQCNSWAECSWVTQRPGIHLIIICFKPHICMPDLFLLTYIVAYSSPTLKQPSTLKESLRRTETFNPPFPFPTAISANGSTSILIWVPWQRWSAERYAFQKWIGWWNDGTVDGGRLEPLLSLRLSPTSFHNALFPFHG